MSKLSTGSFDKDKIQALQKQVSKPQLLKIHEGSVKKDFEKLHEDGQSLLTTDSKYIVFCGLVEFTDRACVHMELKNPTKKTILFNIRTPASPVFFVKPHVGMIDPHKKVTLYFTFRGKCHRVPSDYCWIYSIYHIEIDASTRDWIMTDEFATTNLRTVWNEKGRGDIQNILHLSCRFDEKEKATTDCKKHKIERNLFLNELGDVVNAGTVEESREMITTPNSTPNTTPNMRPGSRPRSRPVGSKLPSTETDELPKTAESTRGGIKM